VLAKDPTGDQKSAPANPDLDIQSVSISEPAFPDGAKKLSFEMKVANLGAAPPPNRQWRILWNYPIGPGGDGQTSFAGRYYVGMNTNSTGQVSFEYGIVTNVDSVPASTQIPMRLGDADPGSNFKPDGTITIIIANNKVGNPAKNDLLGTVAGRTFAGNGNATVRTTAAIDLTNAYSTPNFATYLLNGNICVNLVLDKTQSTDTAIRVGDDLTYTLKVKNKGRTPATGVVLTDNLPSSMAFVSVTTTQGVCRHAGGIVTCNLGTIPGEGLVTVQILVRPQTPGLFRNFATVRSKEDDNDPVSNSDNLSTRVIAAR
jgi:uncharacterized repeat protein (TIGR01451 family)